ncbi:MAG: GH3 auxin-responsive promoter family protein [Spirochaetes bacterium]|nr:GH3 auxin-responsive promoter family protein [Spirochaetota bacterium]
MTNVTELLRQGKKDEIWDIYCGFLDLDVDEFMEIQNKLLMDQIGRLKNCKLGKKLLGSPVPNSVEEFRERVPLTTYSDYSDYLLEKREDVLPEKPYLWVHTSGRSGEYKYKWVPYTKGMYDILGEGLFAIFILSSCKKKGDVVLKEGDKMVFTLAPLPYISGLFIRTALDQFNFKVFPSYEEAIKMDFQERIKVALQMALTEGLDFFYGISSLMLKISEQFSQTDKSMNDNKEMKSILRNPKALLRLIRALLKAKLHKRSILPKDIWKLKAVMCGGTDTSIFRDKIIKLWGKTPYEGFGSTEFGIISDQSWNTKGMVFLPKNNFWEFIPEEEYTKWVKNKQYVPNILTLKEVESNRKYVLVGTNFHGGILTRYISDDLIEVISVEDKGAGLKLPQIVFSSRIGDLIDMGGFTRLTEKVIWKAIEDAEILYEDWIVRKEYKDKNPVLHLYIELKNNDFTVQEIEDRIHECLKKLDEPYNELETMAGVKPLQVSVLTKGTFSRYIEERQAAGADLAHLKPKRMNPSDTIMNNILRMSSWQL